jgi:hypothetical protein
LWHPDCSCCRDKVNRVASRRAVVMVFASPPRQFYRDGTTHGRLSGLSHLDNFIVKRKSCPLAGTLQKHMPTPTQTATPYTTGPLAVRQIATKLVLHHDFRRASKSFAARPYNRSIFAKHMVFCTSKNRLKTNLVSRRIRPLLCGSFSYLIHFN